MAVENNLSTPQGGALSIDFSEQFNRGIRGIREILNVTRELPVPVGGSVKIYTDEVTLDGGNVEAGEIIPLSKVVRTLADTIDMTADKRRKSVPVEDVMAVGYEKAIEQTDAALLRKLYANIRTGLISGLAQGTAAVSGNNLQATLAKAVAGVGAIFEDEDVESVAFISFTDLADYYADHQVTLESENGLQYLKNFLGFDVVIVSNSVPAGTLYATASQNLVFAYSVIGGEVTRAFPAMYTDPEMPMIGILHDTQHERLTAETVTLSNTAIFAENLAGVVVGTIGDGGASA